MTELKALEEFIETELSNPKGLSPNGLVPDLLDYFTSNVPTYNKELEEENVKLKEHLDTLKDLISTLALHNNDLQDEVKSFDNPPIVYTRRELP